MPIWKTLCTMKYTLVNIFFILSCLCFAQISDNVDADRFGVYAKIDEAYNFSDNIFIGASDQKISVGLTYAQKNGKYVVFLGGGLRFFKYTYTVPKLTSSFNETIDENYIPVQQSGFDSLVGAAMSQGGYFSGSTGAWLHASFSWINRYRPTITFYYGAKGTPSYGPGYLQYTDPEYQDIEYAQLSNSFYEIRIGFSPPFLNKRDWPFSACIDAGFRLNDYKDFSIGEVPISSYTNPTFANKYRFNGCFTMALTFCFWSNWTWN